MYVCTYANTGVCSPADLQRYSKLYFILSESCTSMTKYFLTDVIFRFSRQAVTLKLSQTYRYCSSFHCCGLVEAAAHQPEARHFCSMFLYYVQLCRTLAAVVAVAMADHLPARQCVVVEVVAAAHPDYRGLSSAEAGDRGSVRVEVRPCLWCHRCL